MVGDRFYALLFAILPKKLQSKLWGHLANKYGYHGLTKFGNGTIHCAGTRKTKDDFYKKFDETMKSWNNDQ